MSTSAAATVVSAAQKASTFANNTVETARFEALKEPLGFIKILQFILAILAFAIAVNGGSYVQFTVACNTTGSQLYQASYSYPYDITTAKFSPVSTQSCPTVLDPAPVISSSGYNIVSSAGFFVFTGVMAFLYSLAFAIIYVFFKHKYDNLVYLPLIDFGSTALFTLFWFAGSIAWAKAINDIQNTTNPETITAGIAKCSAANACASVAYPSYGNLVVSCILGFGNLILWAGDVWFVLKETSWYKTRRQMQEAARNVTNNPISSSAGGNITATYNPNNKI